MSGDSTLNLGSRTRPGALNSSKRFPSARLLVSSLRIPWSLWCTLRVAIAAFVRFHAKKRCCATRRTSPTRRCLSVTSRTLSTQVWLSPTALAQFKFSVTPMTRWRRLVRFRHTRSRSSACASTTITASSLLWASTALSPASASKNWTRQQR